MSPHHKRQIKHGLDKLSQSLEVRVKQESQKETIRALPEEAFLNQDIIHAILLYTHKAALNTKDNTLKEDHDYIDSQVDTPTNPETYADKTKYLYEHLSPIIKKQLSQHYIPKTRRIVAVA